MLYYYEKLVRENYRFGRMPESRGSLPRLLCIPGAGEMRCSAAGGIPGCLILRLVRSKPI